MPDDVLKVYVLPDYREDNPYQQLLMSALDTQGVKSRFARGYKRGFPVFRGLRRDYPEADVVHLHWPDPFYKGKSLAVRLFYGLKLLVDLLLVRFVDRKRLVWTLHNYGRHDDSFPRLTEWLMCCWMKTVHHVLILNESDRVRVQARYRLPEKKVTVTLHGQYQSVYGPCIEKPVAREKLMLPEQARVFLFLGMIKPYKGLERLLACWGEHARTHPDDLLLIAGDSPDSDYVDLMETRAQALGCSVRFDRGFVADEQIPAYFGAADVAVLPFEQVSNSGSLLLAMSYGCPIIAPDFPVVKEGVGKADALLYSSLQQDHLLEHLRRVDETDLTLIRKRVHDELRRFDWNRIAEKTREVYAHA